MDFIELNSRNLYFLSLNIEQLSPLRVKTWYLVKVVTAKSTHACCLDPKFLTANFHTPNMDNGWSDKGKKSPNLESVGFLGHDKIHLC